MSDSLAEDASKPSPWTIAASDATFQAEVIDRSHQLPVVVDFWASWCAPCRMLGPILESLAEEYAGKFLLAKADTEKAQQAAAHFGVQSIPAVFSVIDGQPDDYFVGLLPESQIRLWLDRMLQRGDLARARRLEGSDPPAAMAIYRQALEENPNQVEASMGLARALAANSQHQEARDLIAALEKRGFLEPEGQRIKAQLELAQSQGDLGKLAAAAADANALPAQLQYAQALAGAGRYNEALDLCLSLVERDRSGVGEQARQTMVDIFRVLGADSDLARDYRRKLTMLLY